MRVSGFVAASAAILLLASLDAYAQQGDPAPYRYYHGPGMMWSGDPWGGFGMIFGAIFMILLLVALVAGALLLVRAFTGARTEAGRDDKALAILRERFARGEIDAKEFEDRKRLIAP